MSDDEPPNNRRSSSSYEDDAEKVNHRIAIIVGVVVAFIFIIVMLFFLKHFAKYVQDKVRIRDSIERGEDGQSNEHRNSSPSEFSRSSLDNISLPSNGIFLEQNLLTPNESVILSHIAPPMYQLPPNDYRITNAADVIPPPSSTEDMRSIPTQNNIIPPPFSSDDVAHRQNPNNITFDEVQRDAYHQNNRVRNNMIDPPTSSGDPHFNDDLQREQLLIGPPPPYTPPGVQVPPQEAYTETILAPSYEESLDHTVV